MGARVFLVRSLTCHCAVVHSLVCSVCPRWAATARRWSPRPPPYPSPPQPPPQGPAAPASPPRKRRCGRHLLFVVQHLSSGTGHDSRGYSPGAAGRGCTHEGHARICRLWRVGRSGQEENLPRSLVGENMHVCMHACMFRLVYDVCMQTPLFTSLFAYTRTPRSILTSHIHRNLYRKSLIPSHTVLVGYARSALTHDGLVALIKPYLKVFIPSLHCAVLCCAVLCHSRL